MEKAFDDLKAIRLNEFLKGLRSAKIHFALDSFRDDAIMVQISVPGERWEVDFSTMEQSKSNAFEATVKFRIVQRLRLYSHNSDSEKSGEKAMRDAPMVSESHV